MAILKVRRLQPNTTISISLVQRLLGTLLVIPEASTALSLYDCGEIFNSPPSRVLPFD